VYILSCSHTFFQAVFELIDHWCTSVDAAEYLNLLEKLEARARKLAAAGHWITPDTVTVEEVPHMQTALRPLPPVSGTGIGISAQPAKSVHSTAGIQVGGGEDADEAAAPAKTTMHRSTHPAQAVAIAVPKLHTESSASIRLWPSASSFKLALVAQSATDSACNSAAPMPVLCRSNIRYSKQQSL
jgi:hypothetical protein